MARRRTICEDKELLPKHTKRIKLEPDLDECDIKIEPFENDDALLCAHFHSLHNIADDMVESSSANRFIKSEPAEDKNVLLNGHFDGLHATATDTMTESTNLLGRLTRNSSTVQERNCIPSAHSRRKTRNDSSRQYLSKSPPVEIDMSESTPRKDTEINAALRVKDNFGSSISPYKDNKHSKLKNYILSRPRKTTSPDESCSFKHGHAAVKFTGEEPFSCERCSFKTDDMAFLKRHILTHAIFSCEICSYTTAQKANLRNHILTHTGERPFSCELCSYTTGQKGHLNRHILTHTGEGPFSCELCSYTAAHRGSLKSHILTHTGEKPFSCELCSYTAARKGNLKSHILSHRGERPFSCEFCSFETYQKASLNMHILTHTGESLSPVNFVDIQQLTREI